MTTKVYSVDDGHGSNVAQGLSAKRAREVAQEHADRTGLACLVYVYGTDDEDDVIHPSEPLVLAKEDPKDRLNALAVALQKADAHQRAQAFALISAALIVARDNPSGYDLVDERIEIDEEGGGTFYVTITTEAPK